MIDIVTYENEQMKKFKESNIFKELKESASKNKIECLLRIGDMLPEFLRHSKIQVARILSVELYSNGNILEDNEGGTYQAFTDLIHITKKGKTKLFEWQKDKEFIEDIEKLISWLNNKT